MAKLGAGANLKSLSHKLLGLGMFRLRDHQRFKGDGRQWSMCTPMLLQSEGAFNALRPEDLRRGVSFSVGVAAWIQPKLYTLVYWRNKTQIKACCSSDLLRL